MFPLGCYPCGISLVSQSSPVLFFSGHDGLIVWVAAYLKRSLGDHAHTQVIMTGRRVVCETPHADRHFFALHARIRVSRHILRRLDWTNEFFSTIGHTVVQWLSAHALSSESRQIFHSRSLQQFHDSYTIQFNFHLIHVTSCHRVIE